jgi:decaprenyl-phosphate phosphoribosyltransferase
VDGVEGFIAQMRERPARRRPRRPAPLWFTAAVLLMAYCQWAFERGAVLAHGHHTLWFELSIVPVVLAVLHLELRFESGHGAAPEDLATGDRLLQVLGLLWVALFAIGIYA